MKILYSSIIVSIRWISHISYLNFFLDNKYTDKMGSKNPYHFRKIILLISILIVVCSVVKGYDIDDDDFCMIRFYKVKHFDDPTPYSHDGNGKRRSYLKEKSIKVIGECCWRVFKKRNYCKRPKSNRPMCIKHQSKLLKGNTDYPDNTKWGLPPKKILSFRRAKC